MNIRSVTAALAAASWVRASASVAALAALALTPSLAAAQDSGAVDAASVRRIELVNDLERALRQAEAARLRGDCGQLEAFGGAFNGMHMKTLPPDVEDSYQRRWREILERPCPPETAAPPPQAQPEEPPPPPPAPADDPPPPEEIPTLEAEPAPPGFGDKPPTIGVPYRSPMDPMIIPPPPKTGDKGAKAAEQEAEEVVSDPPPEEAEPAPAPPKKRPR